MMMQLPFHLDSAKHRVWIIVSSERTLKFILAIIFIAVLVAQGAWHLHRARALLPYERWDEVSVFNNVHVLTGPAAARPYRYGPIDTFLQWASTAGYNSLTIAGAGYDHIRYSNNVPASWNDPHLPYTAVQWPGIDYPYFRGIDDRYSIYISRIAHLMTMYIVIALTGLFLIFELSMQSILVVVPLLLLTVVSDIYDQAAQSIPGSINSALAFTVVILSALYLDKFKNRYLMLAAVSLSIGVTVKTDFLPLGIALALCIIITAFVKKPLFAIYKGIQAFLLFLITFVALNPFLIADGRNQAQIAYAQIFSQMARTPRPHYIELNLDLLAMVLGGALFHFLPGVSLYSVAVLLVACLGFACFRRTRYAFALALAGAVTVVLFAVPVLTAYETFDRYLFNGLGALMATIAVGLIVLWRSGQRMVASAAFLLVAGLYTAHSVQESQASFAIFRAYKATSGLDPIQHRNLAVLYAIQAAKSGNYSKTILVDQHTYTDLRQLRISGLKPEYINFSNAEETIAKLPKGMSYIVIFGKGDVGDCNHLAQLTGDWSDDMKKAYSRYIARFEELPVLQHYEGTRQCLMAVEPMEANREADLTVAVLSVPPG